MFMIAKFLLSSLCFLLFITFTSSTNKSILFLSILFMTYYTFLLWTNMQKFTTLFINLIMHKLSLPTECLIRNLSTLSMLHHTLKLWLDLYRIRKNLINLKSSIKNQCSIKQWNILIIIEVMLTVYLWSGTGECQVQFLLWRK